ncbi:MAG: hypothetical protein N2690_00205 [Rhodocyclaceae bacterium]|nr:hypothetical protein [Rhodocyclaceae bacterium]
MAELIAAWIFKALIHVILFFAKCIVYIALIYILVYMFAGWIKAMLGLAFSPIGILLLPLDKGRFLINVGFYIAGALATYAFALAVGIIALAMFAAGADIVVRVSTSVQQSGASGDELRMYSLGFALAVILLSVLVIQVVINAKHWGAEYFGTRAFDMGMKAPSRIRGNSSTSRKGKNSGYEGSGQGGSGQGGSRTPPPRRSDMIIDVEARVVDDPFQRQLPRATDGRVPRLPGQT